MSTPTPIVPLDHLALAAFAFDANDRIVSCNAAAAELYGIAAEEAVGQSVYIFIPHDAVDDYHFAVELVKRYGTWHGELRTMRANYELRLVETAWSYSSDADGNRFVVAIHRDVTEQRSIQQAEKRLAVLNAMHSLIFEIARTPGLPTVLAEQCIAFLDQPIPTERVIYSGVGHTLLLVCYDSLRLEWYRLLLENYHYRVLAATDRFQLQDRLRDHRDSIHLALVAVGDESTATVSEIWRVRPLLPIVVIDPSNAIPESILDHPVTVLRSPLTARNLLHILALALSGEHGSTNDWAD